MTVCADALSFILTLLL